MKVLAHRFFKTTTEIQSGQDAFDESRLVKTFLPNLEVTEILCSFRLVLEGQACKKVPESSSSAFLETFSANNFALSDSEDNTIESLEKGGIEDLPFTFVKNTISNLPSHKSLVSWKQ